MSALSAILETYHGRSGEKVSYSEWMDESYCALCGVCFGVYTELHHNRVQVEDVAWTEYFLALRRRLQSPDVVGNTSAFSYFLSGVGIELGAKAAYRHLLIITEIWMMMIRRESTLATLWLHMQIGTGREVVYPMHPDCWDIFLQNHALLARENVSTPNLDILADLFNKQEIKGGARGMVPDWTYDYEGAEEFWADGWAYHEEPEASEVPRVLDWSSEWSYLVHDPNAKKGFDELLANPPLVSVDELPRSLESNLNETDFFQHFPEEILVNVLCFIPTPSVQAVRLASRRMARCRTGLHVLAFKI
ncbi:hypothetical protein MMC22_008671 [Lobaria immixta]|nr:hypothetical protein [Lobaria immixta]